MTVSNIAMIGLSQYTATTLESIKTFKACISWHIQRIRKSTKIHIRWYCFLCSLLVPAPGMSTRRTHNFRKLPHDRPDRSLNINYKIDCWFAGKRGRNKEEAHKKWKHVHSNEVHLELAFSRGHYDLFRRLPLTLPNDQPCTYIWKIFDDGWDYTRLLTLDLHTLQSLKMLLWGQQA